MIAQDEFGNFPAEGQYYGIPVYRFPFYKVLSEADLGKILEIRAKLAAIQRAFKPDVAHINRLCPETLFLKETARAHPAPVLVTLHGMLPDAYLRPQATLGSTLLAARWVTACSAAVLREARRQLPEIAHRSSVILNSLDLPAIVPPPPPLDAPRLLCLGRTSPEKGFDLALAAFATLADRWPRLRLVIAGDGHGRAGLERQAAELGVADRVDFLGWVAPAEVPAVIGASTIVAMPSRCEEAFGLVALQAAQMARPVVATRVGGLPEVVVDRQTGLLVAKEDSRALAEAIAHLLDRPVVALRMGAAARRRAQAVFNWERHVAAYDALYRRLAAEGARPAPRDPPGSAKRPGVGPPPGPCLP